MITIVKCNKLKCIYTENEQGFMLSNRFTCKYLLEVLYIKIQKIHADTCKIDRYGNLPAPVVGNTDYLYYLSNDTSNTLDDFIMLVWL